MGEKLGRLPARVARRARIHRKSGSGATETAFGTKRRKSAQQSPKARTPRILSTTRKDTWCTIENSKGRRQAFSSPALGVMRQVLLHMLLASVYGLANVQDVRLEVCCVFAW